MATPSTPRIFIGVADPTPLGPVWVATTLRGLAAVQMDAEAREFVHNMEKRLHWKATWDKVNTTNAVEQIKEYLNGTRQRFDLE